MLEFAQVNGVERAGQVRVVGSLIPASGVKSKEGEKKKKLRESERTEQGSPFSPGNEAFHNRRVREI